MRNERTEQWTALPKWLVLFSALVFSCEVGAQQSVVARELIGIGASFKPENYTQSGRAKIVRLVAAYCREVLNVLPTNTPEEDAWVEAEGNTTDLAKVQRLVATPQYNRREAKYVFSTCEEKAGKGLDGTGSREAAAFISLALNFHDPRSVESYASRAGLNVKALGLDFIGTVQRSLLLAAMYSLP
jgi:hypothetical protein